MNGGVLAKIAVHDAEVCPVSSLSEGRRITSVSQGQPTDGRIPIEITTQERFDDDVEAQQIFSYDSDLVYRLNRPADLNCPCEQIQQTGCPIRDVRAVDGTLVLSFIAPDVGELRGLVDSLQEQADAVHIRCLKYSESSSTDADPVLLDRKMFTERQREVIATAHEMGYFDHPKRANGSEVAAELGITQPTFAEHLSAVQQKLMDALLENRLEGPEE